MRLLSCLFVCFTIVATIFTTTAYAEWWREPKVTVHIGTITNYEIKMGHERGQHAAYFDLDETTTWAIVNFDLISELNWEVGDRIKIYFESGEYRHTAENMSKHNLAYVIQIN